MPKAVLCLAKTEIQATAIVQLLSTIGIRDQDISVLFPNPLASLALTEERQARTPETAARGTRAGGLTGGVLGWFAGMGMLAIPGVGHVMAAGPIVATLAGAAVGATLGGIAGMLVDMGISENDATVYETKIKDGNIFISAQVPDMQEAHIVSDLYGLSHAQDISIIDAMSARADRSAC